MMHCPTVHIRPPHCQPDYYRSAPVASQLVGTPAGQGICGASNGQSRVAEMHHLLENRYHTTAEPCQTGRKMIFPSLNFRGQVQVMKKLLLAGVSVFSLGTAASAADLAARPYTKAPALAPGYNWSGFYAGVMGGYAWATNGNGSGGFGGGTLGYNWQAPGSQYVFGIEVDGA